MCRACSSNLLVDHPAYRSALRRMLPALQTLDGERTILADAALPGDASDALNALAFAEPEPWLKDFRCDVVSSGQQTCVAEPSSL